VATLARSISDRRSNTSDHLFTKSGRKSSMEETFPVTRTTTTDASKGSTTCVVLMAMIETPETSPSSPTLEGEATLETFLSKRRRWLTARAVAPPHLHPAFLISKSGSCNAGLHCSTFYLAVNSRSGHGRQQIAVRRRRVNLAGNTNVGVEARSSGQRRAWRKHLIILLV
jgi:hypothetical protein